MIRNSRSAFRCASLFSSTHRRTDTLNRTCVNRLIMTSQANQNKDFDPKKLTNADWEKRLTPEEYHVAREAGTERPFTGEYTSHFENGTYTCTCCGADLFLSDSKFESGCGWPAFSEAKGAKGKDETEANVLRRSDNSFGMTRVEVICKKCDAHLGHVFEDGPKPSGERFCINSVSLRFNPKKKI